MSHYFPTPAYADMLLCLVDTTLIPSPNNSFGYFREYFASVKPNIQLLPFLDGVRNRDLGNCLRNSFFVQRGLINISLRTHHADLASCLNVAGVRGLEYANAASLVEAERGWPNGGTEPIGLRTADVLWLYFMEKAGSFLILEQLIRDYADEGKLDLSIAPRTDSEYPTVVLELFTRLDENNNGSQVQDRESLYQRCLGWSIGYSARQPISYKRATLFETHFHEFIRLTIAYYDQRDALATIAAGGGAAPATFASSIQSIASILEKLRFDLNRPFELGRNYQNCLLGIVSAISTFSLIEQLREVLGIERSLTGLPQLFSSAYTKVVPQEKRSGSQEMSRFLAYRDCATHGRNLLLCIGQNNFDTTIPFIENWINQVAVRTAIMSYRQGWKEIMGVDLAPVRILSRS